MPRFVLAPLVLVLALLVASAGGATLLAAIARGDEAYSGRAASLEGERADPAAIEVSIAAYREALAADGERIDTRWRLLRSLYYRGDFANVPPETKRSSFEAGRALSEESVALLTERLGGDPLHELDEAERRVRLRAAGVSPSDAARLYFWAAVHWGAWSRDAGLLESVRRGVANRVHDYALVCTDLEPGYERAGAHRLLARMHATLPKVPFVSGWVDRSRAIPEAERALVIAPEDPGNRYLLAITLLDLAPGRSAEARAALREVAVAEPRPELLVEDLTVVRLARERLAALGKAELASAR